MRVSLLQVLKDTASDARVFVLSMVEGDTLVQAVRHAGKTSRPQPHLQPLGVPAFNP